MTQNKQTELMLNTPVPKAILKMSIPVVLGMMVQVFYNLIDTFFIGKLKDPNQLAAANITTPIFMLMMASLQLSAQVPLPISPAASVKRIINPQTKRYQRE